MSEVFLLPTQNGKTPRDRLVHLLKQTDWIKDMDEGSLVALKLHFGERNNKGQIPPECVAELVKGIKARNGKPFLSETATLYVGQRSNSYDHTLHAISHGYGFDKVGAPILMADGLRGQSQITVPIDGEHFKEVKVASDTRVYDAMLVLTHVTGHVAAGLGGAIKNLGMGLSSRAGKRAQHSSMDPDVSADKCIACGQCTEWCPAGAIQVLAEGEPAVIDRGKCIGCGECLTVCPSNAIQYDWNADKLTFQSKMTEYALGVVKGKESSTGYLSFLTSITKNCDCMGSDNEVLVSDIGVLASRDPVAIDQASADLVNKAYGKDFFAEMFPGIDYTSQLAHGEKIGLGSRKYELIEV